MDIIKNGSSDVDQYLATGPDSPIKRYLRGEDNTGRIDVNVFYSASAGSDAIVMEEIGERIEAGMPIALRSANSVCVFVPTLLTAYWYGKQNTFFRYADRQAFVDGIKLQYLTHKELLSTEMLLEISKTILCLEK